MANMPDMTVEVMNIPLFSGSIEESVQLVQNECKGEGNNHCISATGAAGLVYAQKNPAFRDILSSFFMNLPDGMPAVWIGRLKGKKEMKRCYGPDFFAKLMKATANRSDIQHFLCGGGDGTADKLKQTCNVAFGNHNIAGTLTPPFLAVDEFDYEEIARKINQSGANIIWIGISTPKQEIFANRLAQYTHVDFLITVGAAFDFHIGNLRQAPGWIQQIGMEWFFRLCIEPRRLWKRYVEVVPLFLWHSVLDLINYKRRRLAE